MDDNIELIRNFNRFYVNYFNRFERDLYQGFPSMNEARVLAFLYFNHSNTATQIQNELGFDKGQLSKIVTKLEKNQLLTRKLDSNDRRHYILNLTDSGEKLHKDLILKSRNYLKNIFKDYNPSILNLIASKLDEVEKLYKHELQINVQSGNLSDIGMIADLHSRIYQEEIKYNNVFHTYVFKSLENYVKDTSKGKIWIATLGDKKVGTVSLVKDDNNYYQLRWFAVDPKFQGLGIGTKLLQSLIKYVQVNNINYVYLWTVDELHGARKLYSKFGFKKEESKPNNDWCERKINEEKWTLIINK